MRLSSDQNSQRFDTTLGELIVAISDIVSTEEERGLERARLTKQVLEALLLKYQVAGA
jgi:hypothetical protein